MNKYSLLVILLVILCSMASCEKDDLCIPEEAATPRLIILFTDNNNPLIRKPVESLQVIESISGTAVPLNAAGVQVLTQVDSIAIPLRIDQNTTQYRFERTLNGALNPDPINFNYTIGEQYINRACGFKAIYSELTRDIPLETPANPWIRNVLVRNSTITSNQDIHVEIRH